MKKACIVGCGNIASTHMKVIDKLSSVSLYAVCDTSAKRADMYSKMYNCKAYYDFNDVINDKEIECVHLCVPHYLHVPMAIKAMRAGKDVITEKPLCMNRTELNQLENEYKNSGKRLCVVLQNRTNLCIQKIKQLITDDNSLGKLTGIFGIMNWHRDSEYYNSEEWRGKWATEGGGAVINQSIHLLDMIEYICHVKSIRAGISTKRLGDIIEVEDTADAFMELEGGGCANFYAANTFACNRPFQLEVCFENAVLRYADNMLYYICDNHSEVICHDNGEILGKSYWGTGHYKVLEQFYNDGDYISFEDAKNSAVLMCALYESAASNDTVVLT